MDAFWVVNVIVPKHSVVWNVRARMSLVTTVHGRELDGVSDEEDREVIKDKILDAVLGVELCRPASNVTNRVGGPLLTPYCRYTGEELGRLSDTVEELGVG
jgi:hypothetical protein